MGATLAACVAIATFHARCTCAWHPSTHPTPIRAITSLHTRMCIPQLCSRKMAWPANATHRRHAQKEKACHEELIRAVEAADEKQVGTLRAELRSEALVDLSMAVLEDVPELAINFWFLSTADDDGFNSSAEASIFAVSSVLALYHMGKCLWHAYRAWHITQDGALNAELGAGVAGLSAFEENAGFAGFAGERTGAAARVVRA